MDERGHDVTHAHAHDFVFKIEGPRGGIRPDASIEIVERLSSKCLGAFLGQAGERNKVKSAEERMGGMQQYDFLCVPSATHLADKPIRYCILHIEVCPGVDSCDKRGNREKKKRLVGLNRCAPLSVISVYYDGMCNLPLGLRRS